MKKELLQELADMQGVLISDLRFSPHLPGLLVSLWKLKNDEYPLSEWQEVFSYLTGRDELISSSDETIQKIIEWVTKEI